MIQAGRGDRGGGLKIVSRRSQDCLRIVSGYIGRMSPMGPMGWLGRAEPAELSDICIQEIHRPTEAGHTEKNRQERESSQTGD